jgi:hypothetical protein
MVIYWADTMVPLTWKERQNVLHAAELIYLGPLELVIQDASTGRKVLVKGITDPTAPPAPAPKALA